MKRLILTIVIILMFATSTQAKEPINKSRDYDLPYEKVFSAVVLTVSEKYPIKTADINSGIVDTDYISPQSITADAFARFLVGGVQAKMNVVVLKISPSQTRVIANYFMDFPATRLGQPQHNASSAADQKLYDGFFGKLERNMGM